MKVSPLHLHWARRRIVSRARRLASAPAPARDAIDLASDHGLSRARPCPRPLTSRSTTENRTRQLSMKPRAPHLRNRKSGAHGRTEAQIKENLPRPRHARLVIHAAHTLAACVIACLPTSRTAHGSTARGLLARWAGLHELSNRPYCVIQETAPLPARHPLGVWPTTRWNSRLKLDFEAKPTASAI